LINSHNKSKTENKDKFRLLILANPMHLNSTSGGSTEPEEYVFEALQSLHLIKKQVEVILKLHPSESLEYYCRLFKRNTFNNLEIKREGDIVHYLTWCDLVVLPNSTVVYEALVFKKPIIGLHIVKSKFGPPLDNKYEISVVDNSADLAYEINKVISSYTRIVDNYEQYYSKAREYAGPIDGCCIQRINKIIEKFTE
jgi:CDP-glycerol glycerophosphotransferase (TagB/SpsB family)